MPELPEVETIKNSLRPHLVRRKILRLEIGLEKLLLPNAKNFKSQIEGKTILELERRGKYLIWHLSGERAVVTHFRLTGQLVYLRDGEPAPPYTHLRFLLDKGALVYADLRQFGRLEILAEEDLNTHPKLKALGPEPFEIDEKTFEALLKGRKRLIKALLLDQTIIAGLGNIYVDEALFRAGILPTRPARAVTPEEASRLLKIIREILREAIACGGSSVRNYVDGEGREGHFQEKHLVYGRRGKPCPRCGTPIAYLTVAQRGTHFCPRCQR